MLIREEGFSAADHIALNPFDVDNAKSGMMSAAIHRQGLRNQLERGDEDIEFTPKKPVAIMADNNISSALDGTSEIGPANYANNPPSDEDPRDSFEGDDEEDR